MGGQVLVLAAYPTGKGLQYPWTGGWVGSAAGLRHFGGRKKSHSPAQNKTASSPTFIPSEQCHLSASIYVKQK